MHLGDPFDARPGQRVSAGLLAEQTTRIWREQPWVSAVTTAMVTNWGEHQHWRVEATADVPAARVRVLTCVDGVPRQDLIARGGTVWEWRAGDPAYTPRPFAEQALAPPAAPLADLALEEELATEVVLLGDEVVDLHDGPARVWRFHVLDSRPRDDDHTTAQYEVQVDARRLVRRVVLPRVQARSETVVELMALGAPPVIDEPLLPPAGGP